MLTLTIDTSGEQYGLAVAINGRVLRLFTGAAGRTLDAVMFGTLRTLLNSVRADLSGVRAIVVCTGPGSFVGTRIGLAAANTLGMARQIPVLGVDILRVLADIADLADLVDLADFAEGAEVTTAVNCVRDEIISQNFRVGAIPEPLGPVTIKPAAEFARAVEGRTVILRPSTLGRVSRADAFPGAARVILTGYPELLATLARLGTAIVARDGLPPLTPLPAPLYVLPEGACA